MGGVLGTTAIDQLKGDHRKLKLIQPGQPNPRRPRHVRMNFAWCVLEATLGPATGLNSPATANAIFKKWSDDSEEYVDDESREVVLRVKNITFATGTTLMVFHTGVEWSPIVADCSGS